MQELRLVFIIVGGLAIAGLLVHGILKSKKETKSKFADIPVNKMEPELSDSIADDAVISEPHIKAKPSERIEPEFGGSSPINESNMEENDPLFGSSDLPFSSKHQFKEFDTASNNRLVEEPLVQSTKQQDIAPFTDSNPTFGVADDFDAMEDNQISKFNSGDSVVAKAESISKPQQQTSSTLESNHQETDQDDKDLDVIVFHVHATGDGELNGAELFPSMKQNGLLYGAMDIFHRHTDTSGTGKVLFSVANMMKPGTLIHDDPQTFYTKGISFFMTLPCFGEPEQNFKLMLRTAQQIADDLGANVLDDKRNLMTPDRIAAYRKQVRDFVERQKD